VVFKFAPGRTNHTQQDALYINQVLRKLAKQIDHGGAQFTRAFNAKFKKLRSARQSELGKLERET